MKQRMVAGYKLQQEGVLAPGEPIRTTVSLPVNATPLCMRIDPRGDFVLFCEVWSHPEGTVINFEEHQYCMIAPQAIVPAGGWVWFETLTAGQQIFHVYRNPHGGKPQLAVAS